MTKMIENPRPETEENKIEPEKTQPVDLPEIEKNLLDQSIEQFLFTPRTRSKQQAREFLKDWMQRYNRV
jgi:hypothetical protein